MTLRFIMFLISLKNKNKVMALFLNLQKVFKEGLADYFVSSCVDGASGGGLCDNFIKFAIKNNLKISGGSNS